MRIIQKMQLMCLYQQGLSFSEICSKTVQTVSNETLYFYEFRQRIGETGFFGLRLGAVESYPKIK